MYAQNAVGKLVIWDKCTWKRNGIWANLEEWITVSQAYGYWGLEMMGGTQLIALKLQGEHGTGRQEIRLEK